MELSAGLMVTPNVRLARPLGRGAMGWVWVGEHLTLRTEVAVKFISAELAVHDEEILTRFLQEATLAAQIKSPHVVQVFDQGQMPDGSPYIVMELLEGQSLQDWLDKRGRLTLQETERVVTHIARALRQAHELGIVHRDIKPDNVYVQSTEDGIFCKVLDFGIAKQTQLPQTGLTNAGVMVGTPEYMSPEQVLSAKDVDYRADLWALAVTAYQMLTGDLPFWAEALGTLCVKLLDGKFKPASELRGDLPAGMDAWFTRALAHSPEDRFTSAREMALDFTRIIQGGMIADEHSLSSSIDHTELLPAGQGPLSANPASVNLAPTAPLPDAAGPLAAGPASAASASSHGTLTGSSSSKHVAPKREGSMAMYIGGTVAIAGLVGALLFLLQSSGDEATEPAAAAASAEAPSAADEAPSTDDAEPPAAEADEADEADAGGDDPEAATSASAEPSAATKLPAAAPQPFPRPPPPSTGGIKRHDHGF